jgi:hypothetical protein
MAEAAAQPEQVRVRYVLQASPQAMQRLVAMEVQLRLESRRVYADTLAHLLASAEAVEGD